MSQFLFSLVLGLGCAGGETLLTLAFVWIVLLLLLLEAVDGLTDGDEDIGEEGLAVRLGVDSIGAAIRPWFIK